MQVAIPWRHLCEHRGIVEFSHPPPDVFCDHVIGLSDTSKGEHQYYVIGKYK